MARPGTSPAERQQHTVKATQGAAAAAAPPSSASPAQPGCPAAAPPEDSGSSSCGPLAPIAEGSTAGGGALAGHEVGALAGLAVGATICFADLVR
jgi:hypothetical protein